MQHPEQSDLPLDLAVRPAAALTVGEREEIVALCTCAFDEDFAGRFDLLPPDAGHVLARLEGRLVGHACWATRWLQPPGQPPLRSFYVGAVATEPATQGRGIGSAVMRRLAAETRDYALGGLSTTRASFYARLGWEPWRGPTAVRTPAGLVPTPGKAVMILRTAHTPPLDFDGLLSAEKRALEDW
ncbi:MAG TPA: GNAT family N-acetyltransferase [Thermomicrobiales bacterium]|nr:GNAT family N-acetyltransferase [Thermomicrobiales bacterium]